jgi:hypothetical protein
LIAGAVFLILDLSVAAMMGSLWAPTQMIAAIVLGSDVVQSPATFHLGVVVTALAVHFVLAVMFAAILSVIMAPFSLDSSAGVASLVGAVFGLGVYLINFYGMTIAFPWFAEGRGWLTLIAHIIFGVVAADMYMALERRPDMPLLGSDSSS